MCIVDGSLRAAARGGPSTTRTLVVIAARSEHRPTGVWVPRPRRRSQGFPRGVAQRTHRGGMRGRSAGWSLGRTGGGRICHLVSRRVSRAAVRLDRNCYAGRRFSRRVAIPLAPEASPTTADGILSDFWNIVVAQWPPLGFRFSFARAYPADRRDRDGPYVASFRHFLDSDYHRAGTRS